MGSLDKLSKVKQNWKIIGKVLMVVQSVLFVAAFAVLFYERQVVSSSYICSFREVTLVACALLLKLVRIVTVKKAPRCIAMSQIKFYTPYLLTIMECIFKYFSQPHQRATEVQINFFLIFLILKNIFYSFLTHEKLTSFIEALVASLTLIGWVILAVNDLLNSVYTFDNTVEDDYKKDLILLFLTTLIANAAMIMDLIFRPIEEMIKEREEEEDEEQEREKHGSKKSNDSCPHCHKELPEKSHSHKSKGKKSESSKQASDRNYVRNDNERSRTQNIQLNDQFTTRSMIQNSKQRAAENRKTCNEPMLDKKIPRYSLREESFGQTARSNTKNHDEAIELSVISKKSQRKDTREIRNQ